MAEFRGDCLSGTFSLKGCRIRLALTNESISWEIENSKKPPTIIPLKQVVAAIPCDCSGLKPSTIRCDHCRIQEYDIEGLPSSDLKFLRLYVAVPFRKHLWKLKSYIFSPEGNANVKEWIGSIQSALSELNRPKNLLVFINPYGGTKKGLKIYEKKVAPIFYLCGIETHVVVTQRANHAKDMIEDLDLMKYDGIICVGGDGMFNEIFNSVLLKCQKEKDIDPNDIYNTLMVPKIPFGIISAGSTNAAACSITGSTDPVSSALLIIMGDCIGVDVCGIYSSGRIIRYAVTFMSYGYFGDVLRDSEKLRWMGPRRYDYTGFKKLMCRKLYEGELQLQVDCTNNPLVWNDRCTVNCDTCLRASRGSVEKENPTKIRWLSVRGRFVGVNTAVISCVCCMTKKGMSPSQHLGNGYCDVIIVSSCSRFNYLRYLLRTSFHHKNPFDLSFVQVYRVREFKFNPFVTDDKTPATGCVGIQGNWQELNTSVWNCDGEIVNEPSVSGKVHCQLINVFGRGFEDRKSDSAWKYCFDFWKKG